MNARAVILAGGKGSRLAPYTTVLPKPLLPVGDQAILDLVVRQLSGAGFGQITLAVGYLAHLVRAVMGDGSNYGISIEYHEESAPLGTVGPLSSIDGLDESFLIMNGDVLTTLDYAELLAIHKASGNVLTVASHRRTVRTEYGVLHLGETGGPTSQVVDYEEKPEIPYIVSMGIYAMEPEALEFIRKGERLDLPDLVFRLLEAGEGVGSYLFEGYWLDIGRHEDYERAIREYDSLEPELFPTGSQPAVAALRSVRKA